MIDLTPILQAVLALAATLITAFVVPYIKSKLSDEQQAKLQHYVTIAVQAAEMLYNGTDQGAEKRRMSLHFWWTKGIR